MSAEIAVAFRDFFVESIAMDVKTTTKVLLSIPDDPSKWGYKPDPKARSAWDLAIHLALTDVSFLEGIPNLNFLNMAEEAAHEKEKAPKTIAALGEWYEKEMNRVLDRVRKMSPEQLNTNIQFFHFNFPAFHYLSFVKSHSIHHRGELATYLRPMGSKVPSIYGPSADEGFGG